MRIRAVVLAGLLAASASLACGTAAAAGRDENPDGFGIYSPCLLYTSPSPRDRQKSRMPSSA